MTLFTDEKVDRQIVERLPEDGHQVVYVAEPEPGVVDEEALARANEDNAVLSTGYKDSASWLSHKERVDADVILVRSSGTSTPRSL